MNELKNQIETLRKTIFKIYENHPENDRTNQENSFKLFVKGALNIQLKLFIERYKRLGLSDAETMQCIVIHPSLYEISSKQIDDCDTEALGSSVEQYFEIVSKVPAYTDVLSLLLESILLVGKRGKGLGQCLTPPSLASGCSELMPMQTDQPFKVMEMCCGAGAFVLAPLQQMMERNPNHAKNATVIANDIDPFMCCTTTLQIIANTVINDIDLCEFTQHCSNVITEWTSGNPYLFRFITPAKVYESRARTREEKLRACGYYEIFGYPANVTPLSDSEARRVHSATQLVGAA